MRWNCSICTDHFGSDQDISAAYCGHVFHEKCLSKWLAQCKTGRSCPQCRAKLGAKQVISKLFFNGQEHRDEELDPLQLREELLECQTRENALKSEKQKVSSALKSMKKDYKELKDVNKTLRSDLISSQHRCDGLIDNMKILQCAAEEAKDAKKELSFLQEKLVTCENIERILSAGKSEVSDMLKRYTRPSDIKEVATWCSSLKQEYEAMKISRDNAKLEVMRLRRASNSSRRELMEKHSEIEELKDTIANKKHSEEQLIDENSGLRKKLDALQKAISSPSDTRCSAISRLLIESPAPMNMTPETPRTKTIVDNAKHILNSSYNETAHRPKKPKVGIDDRSITTKKIQLPLQNTNINLEPKIKIIDTTNTTFVKQEDSHQFALPSGSLSRRRLIRGNTSFAKRASKVPMCAKAKPFTSKPVMSSSLRPTINLLKKPVPR